MCDCENDDLALLDHVQQGVREPDQRFHADAAGDHARSFGKGLEK